MAEADFDVRSYGECIIVTTTEPIFLKGLHRI
jgi:hypothetical protein